MKELKRYGLDSFDCIVPMSDGGLYMRDEADARIAELTDEVIRLRQAHEYIAKSWPDSFAARESRSVIARNALKDGL